MAACVISFSEGLRGSESPALANTITQLQWLTKGRIPAGIRYASHSDPPPCYQPLPPAYEDTLDDLLPDYTATDALACAQVTPPLYLPSKPENSPWKALAALPGPLFADTVLVDWTSVEKIRIHISKKQKKAQQKAQQAKWADSDHEGDGAKDGGEEGGNDEHNSNDGHGGGAGGGDDGNGGDDGKGGDDEEDWDYGSKKKKKGKKGKKQEEEEDEEKKEEEHTSPAAATTSNIWDNLDGAGDGVDPVDEWGTSTGKKNKKKNKKVCATCFVFASYPAK